MEIVKSFEFYFPLNNIENVLTSLKHTKFHEMKKKLH